VEEEALVVVVVVPLAVDREEARGREGEGVVEERRGGEGRHYIGGIGGGGEETLDP